MSGRSSLIMGKPYQVYTTVLKIILSEIQTPKITWIRYPALRQIIPFHLLGDEPFTGQTFYPEHWSQNPQKSHGSYDTAFFWLWYSATIVLASAVRLSIWSTWWADTGSCMQNGQRWCFATGQLSWKFPNCWIHQKLWNRITWIAKQNNDLTNYVISNFRVQSDIAQWNSNCT